MKDAIERTAAHGVSLTGLRNSFHVGRIGHWAEQCADAGLGSIHFVNVVGHDPLVAPFGGREGRFSTNPVCIALPGSDGVLSILDMATSKIALGKARVASRAGRRAPVGTLLDAAGVPTEDPDVMFREPMGALVAMGDHKGSGLAIMAELLAGALTGSGTVQPGNGRPGGPVNGMFSVVFDPEAFGVGRYLDDEGRAFLDYVTGAAPVEPGGEVLVPGEPERRRKIARLDGGIPLTLGEWDAVTDAARSIGAPVPDIV